MNPDFSDRTYTAEVMKTLSDPSDAVKAILRLTTGPRNECESAERLASVVRVIHTFIATKEGYHRFARTLIGPNRKQIEIPRHQTVREVDCYLYDVLIAQCQRHIVVAVPFHDLAERFFVRVDRALAGTRTLYERLDITNMVIRLGSSGIKEIRRAELGEAVALSVTRCHLAYAEAETRSANLQQVRMTGANLGAAAEYRSLIAPVLSPRSSSTTITPVVLGFALSTDGVRKSSATTDRHGNFKIWVAPGVRRLIRLFALLDTLEAMENVTFTTSNVPILQSKTIRDAED